MKYVTTDGTSFNILEEAQKHEDKDKVYVTTQHIGVAGSIIHKVFRDKCDAYNYIKDLGYHFRVHVETLY